jgi:hypothetical protein
MTHPGLLMARMVAATPKQIAMARQMVNSESHILHPPNSLSYLSCVFAACSARVSLRSSPFDERAARRAARGHAPDAYGTRISTQLYLECYCACRRHQGCHCMETETSVRLRFLGSSPTSRLLACI